MAGPRMARMIGASAAALGAVVVADTALGGAHLAAGTWGWAVLIPAALAAAYWCLRLAMWTIVWAPADATTPDAGTRVLAEAACRTTEIAVVCDGESMVLVRTSVIAAIASTGAPSRVLVVGADPRLETVARSLGVRRVTSAIGPDAAIAAAVAAANGTHLALVQASTAVLPGALRPALERLDGGGTWVQCDPVAAVDRLVADHVRHERWWPALDSRQAMPWLGLGSIVVVEAFRTLPLGRGAAATTIAAQTRGWHGRWQQDPITVEQADGRRSRDREIDARAARLRQFRTRSSAVVARRLTVRQRMAHIAQFVEDLSGVAALLGVAAVVAALVTARLPAASSWSSWSSWSSSWSMWGGVTAVAMGWLARLLLTGGLVRPGGWMRASADDLVPSVCALGRSCRGARPVMPATATKPLDQPRNRTGNRLRNTIGSLRGADSGLLVLVAVVDVAMAWRAIDLVRDLADGVPTDVAATGVLLAAGSVTVASLLAASRVVRRNRTLRSSRRLPAAIVARIGAWEGQVLDLGAGGLRAVFGAPAELLAEVPLQLIARGVRPIEVRVQVVRVEPRDNTWVLGLRLAGGGLAGEHDDYLALWLSQMSGAAEGRPRPQPDPAVGRMPVRAAGAPALRLLTAAAMLAVGVAVLPPVHSALASPAGNDPGRASVVAASTTTTPPDTGRAGTDPPGSGDPELSAADPTPTVGRDRPLASVGDLAVVTSVDDTDRIVGGGERVTHTARLRNLGTAAVTAVDLLVAPGAGTIDPTSISGTCPGGDTATSSDTSETSDTSGSSGSSGSSGVEAITWALFDDSSPLGAGDDCTVTWRLTLPPARDLPDGAVLTTLVQVERFVLDTGDAGAARTGPSVSDELVVGRPTLRVTADADGGADVARMTIGVPFTWVLRVSNVSLRAASAYGLDLVHTLPPNWTYTSTVSVSPITCDVAPVVLVDDVASTQTVTWSDMCDLDQGEELVLVFMATPQPAAADSPGVVTATGARSEHVSTVVLTAEDAGGASLGSASDRAAAVARSVDLSVRLTDVGPDDGPADPATSDPGMVVGGLSRYRIDVANEGPDRTTSPITVGLTLPPGVVAIQATGDGWSCELGGTTTCVRVAGVRVADATPPIVVVVAVGDAAVGEADGSAVVTATAAVTTTELERDTADDFDEETSPVRRLDAALGAAGDDESSMSLVALTADRQVWVGDEVEYEVIVASQGAAAYDAEVDVAATMPPGLRIVDASGPGWGCEVERPAGGETGSWSCVWERDAGSPIAPGTVLGPIIVRSIVTAAAVIDAAPGVREPFGHVVTIGPAAPGERDQSRLSWVASPRTTLTVAVTVEPGPIEPGPVEPGPIEPGPVEPGPDESDGRSVWLTGEPRTVEVMVATDGPSGEYGPVVVELPLGDLTVVVADGEGWTCTRNDGNDGNDGGTGAALRCEHGRWGIARSGALIGPGDSLPPIRMTLVADTDGELVQPVRARGVTDEEVRTATLAIEVERRLGLSLAAEAPARVAVTGAVELRWTVVNDGPSATNSGMAITGAIPTGWTFLGADAPGWVCESSLADVSCHTDEALASGANDTLTLAMAVGPDALIGATPLTATLQPDSIDVAVDATSGDDSTEVEVWVSSAPSTDAVEAAPASVGTASVPAQENDASSAGDPAAATPTADGAGSVATLAGYGGAVGAFAFAVVLISGRRRRHW